MRDISEGGAAKMLPPTMEAIWGRRSPAELRELAQIKRFVERTVGDPLFRQKLAENLSDLKRVAVEYGIDVDPNQLKPLFMGSYAAGSREPELPDWPLVKRWGQYIAELLEHRDSLRICGDTARVNPRFHRWRVRQMARVASELGSGAAAIVHPIVAYELSQGCSVGCWFCGISADKFGGYFPFTSTNESLWRSVLRVMDRRFGAAAQTGFCYWATDPSDNPDYLDFVRVHCEITGRLPQTTTAAPLRNIDFTRDLLQLFAKHKHVLNRFSILSVGQLRRVHEAFSAEELLGVELVQQQRGAITAKAMAGRARMRLAPGEKSESEAQATRASGNLVDSKGTIACVTGFLVNMVQGSIRLVSPTVATDTTPDGYHVYGERRFADSEEFERGVDELIGENMALAMPGSQRLVLRGDLSCEESVTGFEVKNAVSRVTFEGPLWLKKMGGVLNNSEATLAQTVLALTANGANVFAALDCLDSIYQAGILSDRPGVVRTRG